MQFRLEIPHRASVSTDIYVKREVAVAKFPNKRIYAAYPSRPPSESGRKFEVF